MSAFLRRRQAALHVANQTRQRHETYAHHIKKIRQETAREQIPNQQVVRPWNEGCRDRGTNGNVYRQCFKGSLRVLCFLTPGHVRVSASLSNPEDSKSQRAIEVEAPHKHVPDTASCV